ncbi:MAG: tripartite tricarboxylate transporter TctB family protein [Paracoccaceae bacterium]|nr:tripartite tricarboxylate transporter TctB family protein [Paracoccaceae bacterium]
MINKNENTKGTETTFPSLLKTDAFIVSAIIVLFSIGLFLVTLNFDKVPPILNRGIQPATFPKILLLFIIFLSFFNYFLALKTPWKIQVNLPKTFYHTLFIMLIFGLISKNIDFFLGLIFLSLTIAWTWGERRILPIIFVSVVFPLLVFLLFEKMLNLRFPGGLLTNLYYY